MDENSNTPGSEIVEEVHRIEAATTPAPAKPDKAEKNTRKHADRKAAVNSDPKAQELARVMESGRKAAGEFKPALSGLRAPRGYWVATMETARKIAVYCPFLENGKLHPSTTKRQPDYVVDWPKSNGDYVDKDGAHSYGVSICLAHAQAHPNK